MAGMLTTTDNPYSPYDQWDQWDAFDRGRGYHTCAYLARVLDPTTEMDEAHFINIGMASIIQNDPFGLYEIVYKGDYKPNSERRNRFMQFVNA
jgi:hypothetical protein